MSDADTDPGPENTPIDDPHHYDFSVADVPADDPDDIHGDPPKPIATS